MSDSIVKWVCLECACRYGDSTQFGRSVEWRDGFCEMCNELKDEVASADKIDCFYPTRSIEGCC